MDIKYSESSGALPGHINNDLDWETVKKLLRDTHKLELTGGIVCRKGAVVVHDNEIAYQLDFDATVTLSILFDKNGKCLSLSLPGDASDEQDENTGPMRDESPAKGMFQQKASHLADMISDINKD